MRLIFHITLLIWFISLSVCSIQSQLKNSVATYLSHLKSNLQKNKENSRFEIKHNDGAKAVIRIFKSYNDTQIPNKRHPKKIKKAVERTDPQMKDAYRLDPVLNFIESRRFNNRRRRSSSSSDSSSSSLELKEWKDEWKELWVQKKLEAINTSEPRGDVVNMVAARPWGVPCGDPNQHDMPWGSCMLPMECDPEYRVFRGDYFCGRSKFVCCAIQLTNYDLYQGFDLSFADSELTTSSEERRNREEGSREQRRKRRRRERRRRRRQRRRRKKRIKKNIRKIARKIRRILNRSYRNGTSDRKKKTKQLKKFIKDLKKKYKKDRQMVQDVHEVELIKIDEALTKKIFQIKALNQNFSKNSTFREMIVNGTISKKGARMLVEAYPEVESYLPARFRSRRSGNVDKPKDYLDYDVEYGMLYY